MKAPAVSTLSNGLGDRTEMPRWNLPLLLTLARHMRAPHHQAFVLPDPEYKAVLHRHGWLFSFWLDSVAELQQTFPRYSGFSSYHPLQSPFKSCKGSHLLCCNELLKEPSKGDATLELRSCALFLAWKAALGTLSMRFLLKPSLCAFLKK